MRARVLFLISVGYLFFFASSALASNFGFMQGNIWYSKDPFFAGDTVRVYSAVLNGTSDDIIGTVSFYSGEQEIGKVPFTASGGGRLQEVWIDWQVTEGDHQISARISSAFITKAGEQNRPISIPNSESGKSVRFADFDTDKDGVGNRSDPDDDGDGVLDSVELEKGTDPLKKNPPPAAVNNAAGGETGGASEPYSLLLSKEGATVAVANIVETIGSSAAGLKKVIESEVARVEKKIQEIRTKETTLIANENTRKIQDLAGAGVATTTRTESQLGDTMKRLLLELYRYVLLAVNFILAHTVLLYLVLAYCVYKVVRLIFRGFARAARFRE